VDSKLGPKPLLKLPADDVTIVQVVGDTELLNL
jgi:hypothetical protein